MSGNVNQFPEMDTYQPPPPNLLGMASNAAALKGQLNQNAMFASQAAQNHLLTQNTKPDGSINMPGYESAVAANPNAQLGAVDAFQAAQNVNNTVLQGTGMSLEQHLTRMKNIANGLQSLLANSGGKGIPRSDMINAIVTQLKNKTITPEEAAGAASSVTNDPIQNAKIVAEMEASMGQNIAAVTPVVNTLQTGSGTIADQTNPGTPSGAYVPNVVYGVPQSQLAQPTSYTDSKSQTVNTTFGGYDAVTGQPTAPQIGGGIAAPPGAPQAPLAQIGAPGEARPAAPQQPGVIMGPAPGVADVQHFNAQQYNQDVQAGSNIAPRISALQELAAAAPGAGTGPASNETAMLRGLGQEFNINVGTDQATQEQVMNKATNMLVNSGLSGLGTPTDAKMMEVIGATPNSKMTPEAVGATVAMTYGSALYQQNLAQAAQDWVNQGGSPAQYPQFKLRYQATEPSPLVLAMPYMPPAAFQSVYKYIKTLPAKDQAIINSQVAAMQSANAPAK